MELGELLRLLDLGNSVAEYDADLEDYFVETSTFEALTEDKADVIAGDKGTGKTALFRILEKRYRDIPQLDNVEVVSAFNPTGNPVFHRLTEGEPLAEGDYITLWKTYILALAGNWLLEIFGDAPSDTLFRLQDLLERTGIRSVDATPSTVFSQIVNLFRRLARPRAAELVVTPRPDGLPLVAGRIEFGEPEQGEEREAVRLDDALQLLNIALEELDLTLWLVLDRLDEAFAGFPLAEIPALRALLRTYLDLNAFPRVRLKLFLRKDLFRRVIAGGFVNLTHINARKVEIVWDEEDLFALLTRRLAKSQELIEKLQLVGATEEEIFYAIFPRQVDAGERKPTTWRWMLGRVSDGNGVRPPRNLIDLALKALEEERRREQRSATPFVPRSPLVGSDALKKGLARLSKERVEDTLLAEAGEHAPLVELFRSAKAEHNLETLEELLGDSHGGLATKVQVLVELGFLEPVGANYKVPMLYRNGLAITQGRAGSGGAEPTSEDEES